MDNDQTSNAAVTLEKNKQPSVKEPGKKNAQQTKSSKESKILHQKASQRSDRDSMKKPHNDPNANVENVIYPKTRKDEMDNNQFYDSSKTKTKKAEIERKTNANVAEKNAVASREKTDHLKICFHALLSPEFDLTPADKVVVRVAVPTSDEWKCENFSPKIVSITEHGYVQLKLLLTIEKDVIQDYRELQYTYFVIKDRPGEESTYLWEEFHDGNSKNKYRTLAVKQEIMSRDEWNQYDGVVYPPKQEEEFQNNVGERFLREKTAERHKQDLKFSLSHFQPVLFHEILSGAVHIEQLFESLMQLEELFFSMRNVYFKDRRSFDSDEDYNRQVIDSILVPVLKSFENAPLQDWKESVSDAEGRMIKAITVLSAVGWLKLELHQKEQDMLATGLLVRPNHEDKKCHDLACIDKFVHKNKKRLVCDFLQSFIESMARTAKDPYIFLCMPLHHFLTGQVLPFQSVSYDVSYDGWEPKWWGIASLSKVVANFKDVIQSSWLK